MSLHRNQLQYILVNIRLYRRSYYVIFFPGVVFEKDRDRDVFLWPVPSVSTTFVRGGGKQNKVRPKGWRLLGLHHPVNSIIIRSCFATLEAFGFPYSHASYCYAYANPPVSPCVWSYERSITPRDTSTNSGRLFRLPPPPSPLALRE